MKREYFTVVLLLLATFGMYFLYKPFLMSIVIASLLALSTTHIQSMFLQWTDNRFWASSLSTLMLSVLFFVPLAYFMFQLSVLLQGVEPALFDRLYQNIELWINHSPKILAPLKAYVAKSLQNFDATALSEHALEYASAIGGFAMSFVTNTIFILVFYFIAQYYGKEIFEFFKRSTHFPQQESTLIIFKMRASMGVVFYSILATAVFEGALFGLAINWMGYNGLLFGIMYGFASLIPVVGGVVMWLPFALFELALGDTESALFITLYSIIVISLIADTFIKPIIIKLINHRLIKPEDKINELIIFFSILAGLSTFGFWGMIVGPAITVLFLTLMKITEAASEEELNR